MEVTISPEYAALVRQKIESGEYRSATDFVEAAMQLLDEHDRLRRLKSALAIGLEQIERGETVRYTPELFQQIREEARRKAQEGHIPDPDVVP